MSKADMHALRFLLIHGDAQGASRISSLLAAAQHTVIVAPNIVEAIEALYIERFDAIVLDAALPPAEVVEFAANLRRIEERQGLARIPVVSISAESAIDTHAGQNAVWDECLQEPLDAAVLTDAVARLAQAIGNPAARPANNAGDELSILEPEEFEEQVGGDRELMVEIIDLFFEEGQRQMAEMRVTLANGNFGQLSRLAHTIKGSLGSLRAPRARSRAHELESAAGAGDANRCRQSFAAFEQDLVELEPQLRSLRERVAGQLPTL